MRGLFLCALWLLVLITFVSSTPEPSRAEADPTSTAEPKLAWFRGSFKKAIEEASLRNVPIVILVMQDNEASCERIYNDVLKDSKIVKHFKKVVAIICATEDHPEKRNKKGTYCTRYGSVPCRTHQAHHRDAYRKLFSGSTMKVPNAVFCKPDLEIVVKLEDETSSGLFDTAFKKVLRAVGRGLSRSELKSYRLAITRSRNFLSKDQYAASLAALQGLSKLPKKSVLAKRVATLRARSEEGSRNTIATAVKEFTEGHHFASLSRLEKLVNQLGDSDAGALAKSTLKKMAKTAEGRKAMRDLKKDRGLQKLFERAEKAFVRKRLAEAVRTLLQIRDRGGDLPTAKRAAVRLEALRKHEKAGAIIAAHEKETQAAELYAEARKAKKAGDDSRVAELLKRLKAEFPKTKVRRRAQREFQKTK
ncbi:MAG: hypothetical protein V3W41_06435 [Planctomycetota bacterium]